MHMELTTTYMLLLDPNPQNVPQIDIVREEEEEGQIRFGLQEIVGSVEEEFLNLNLPLYCGCMLGGAGWDRAKFSGSVTIE